MNTKIKILYLYKSLQSALVGVASIDDKKNMQILNVYKGPNHICKNKHIKIHEADIYYL